MQCLWRLFLYDVTGTIAIVGMFGLLETASSMLLIFVSNAEHDSILCLWSALVANDAVTLANKQVDRRQLATKSAF